MKINTSFENFKKNIKKKESNHLYRKAMFKL